MDKLHVICPPEQTPPHGFAANEVLPIVGGRIFLDVQNQRICISMNNSRLQIMVGWILVLLGAFFLIMLGIGWAGLALTAMCAGVGCLLIFVKFHPTTIHRSGRVELLKNARHVNQENLGALCRIRTAVRIGDDGIKLIDVYLAGELSERLIHFEVLGRKNSPLDETLKRLADFFTIEYIPISMNKGE